jgi:2-amino-4-hydroxy-6-hydroxymethyldihydropteridine diphosphokinase
MAEARRLWHANLTVSARHIYLSLGSNIGDRDTNLRSAIAALEDEDICVLRVSSFYETEPVDFLKQPWFLNCVVEAETDLSPQALLTKVRSLEHRLGREKEFAKGPRQLDIDILLYDDQTVATADLQIPHPRMTQRRFVLVPLAELAPDLHHATWPGTVQDLLASTSDRSQVRKV